MAPKRKAAAASAAPAPKKKAATAEKKADVAPETAGGKALIIEAWASKLEKLLKEANPDLGVSINPDKPRKGCFEVRSGDKVFISLLDMPRPFTKLKAVDMEELAKEISGQMSA